MNFVEVVYLSLDDYAERANRIAHRNGRASFLMLRDSEIENPEDLNEFSFIMKAVGDQLLHREWESFANKPTDGFDLSASVEPEMTSGSTFWMGVAFDSTRICRTH